jgi:hypothetical protein
MTAMKKQEYNEQARKQEKNDPKNSAKKTRDFFFFLCI